MKKITWESLDDDEISARHQEVLTHLANSAAEADAGVVSAHGTDKSGGLVVMATVAPVGDELLGVIVYKDDDGWTVSWAVAAAL